MDERAEFFIRAGGQEDKDDLLEELNQLEADALAGELEDIEIGGGAIKGKAPAMGVTSGASTAMAAEEDDDARQLAALMM